ncbi:SMI1/KNR4 family protein [Edaphovirga cremea]|uniref:SMI1/KNR4 family protein n=1 Tax=Edaphovirga cremea TaxID=2267246 RepID=UPI003988EFAC
MNIDRLNINNGGIPTPGFNGDISLISDIEKLIGFALPSDYIKMLKLHDGGHPELDTYSLTQNNTFGVSKFYSIGSQKYETLESAISRWGKVLGNGMLPIAKDGGDNQFYLDLNEKKPSVWIYLHDENETRVKLASSLEEFIEGLNVNPDYL